MNCLFFSSGFPDFYLENVQMDKGLTGLITSVAPLIAIQKSNMGLVRNSCFNLNHTFVHPIVFLGPNPTLSYPSLVVGIQGTILGQGRERFGDGGGG